MVWFLRAIELPDGRWRCRHGLRDFNDHPSLERAVEHLRDMATEIGPAQYFAHYRDGRVVELPPAEETTAPSSTPDAADGISAAP